MNSFLSLDGRSAAAGFFPYDLHPSPLLQSHHSISVREGSRLDLASVTKKKGGILSHRFKKTFHAKPSIPLKPYFSISFLPSFLPSFLSSLLHSFLSLSFLSELEDIVRASFDTSHAKMNITNDSYINCSKMPTGSNLPPNWK